MRNTVFPQGLSPLCVELQACNSAFTRPPVNIVKISAKAQVERGLFIHGD